MADRFQMVDCDFGKDINAEVERYVDSQLDQLMQSHRDLHKNKLPKWRKAYLGRPSEETRNFPFPNAANTVVQVIGETVDAMVARVMGLLWATHPLWVYQNFVKSATDDERKMLEMERQTIETFMDTVGTEPTELDLHPVESLWYTDTSNLGAGFVKISMENNVEAVVTGYTDSSNRSIRGTETDIYVGPKVTNLRYEDVLCDPRCPNLDESNFVAVRRNLTRFMLEERKFLGIYSQAAVDKIIALPDRSTPSEPEKSELQDQGISAIPRDHTAEWEIWECYFPWLYNGRKYRLIYSYHKATKTVLRKVFNFLPDNMLPVEGAKNGNRTNGLHGHGYAELLEIYQEELSTVHNQRLDNATVANIRALRISPRARALDSNCELYPAALLIGEKDEIEAVQVGDVYPSTFKNEELTLALVRNRAAVQPAIAGSGAGGMMRNGNAAPSYSAQGTLAVLQENNSSVGFATAEFRRSHVKLGSKLTRLYGKFGTFGKEQMFGLDSERLTSALERFSRHRGLAIPIRSSDAALNREVEKQTGMLMTGVLQRHYTAVGQLLQAVANPMAPQEFKDYAMRVIAASEHFHRKIVKDFGYDQPDLYIPEAFAGNGEQQNQGAGQGGEMAAGEPSVEGAEPAAEGAGSPVLPIGNMAGLARGLGPLARG